MTARFLTLFLIVGVLGACTHAPRYAVPTDSARITCQGGAIDSNSGIHLVLHGRLEGDIARTWVNDSTEVVWPGGYEARFEPSLVIYDSNGVVRGREGEDMAASVPWHGQPICMNRDNGALSMVLVGPPPQS